MAKKNKKAQEETIHQPVDKLFKKVFEHPRVIKELIEAYLPEQLAKNVDFSTLSVKKTTFVNEHFRAKETDLLYSMQYKDRTVYIYLLVEMQTTVDHDIALRLMGYLYSFFDLYRKQHPREDLPLVYPLVLYAGEQRWKAPVNFFDLFGQQKKLAQHILTKDINFVDIQRLSDTEIEQHKWLGLFEFVLKYRHTQDVISFFEKAFPWLSEIEELCDGQKYSSIISKYIMNQLNINNKKLFVEAVNRYLSSKTRGEIMTIAQAFKLEGLEEGRQEGRQEGRLVAIREMVMNMLVAGIEKEKAAKIANIDLHELNELLQEEEKLSCS